MMTLSSFRRTLAQIRWVIESPKNHLFQGPPFQYLTEFSERDKSRLKIINQLGMIRNRSAAKVLDEPNATNQRK
jgi:hypothetical protein